MKKYKINEYCHFLDVHRQFYCNTKIPSNYNYDYEYCVLLSKLYSDCLSAYVKNYNK